MYGRYRWLLFASAWFVGLGPFDYFSKDNIHRYDHNNVAIDGVSEVNMRDIPNWDTIARPLVKSLQLITIALVLGVVILAGIISYLVRTNGPIMPAAPIWSQLSILLGVYTASILLMAFTFPASLVRQMRTRIAQNPQGLDSTQQTQQLLLTFRNTHIIRLALMESVALVAIIVYFLEGQTAILAVAAVMLMIMTFQFPNSISLLRWVEIQWILIEDLCQQLKLTPKPTQNP